jgi:hypothetical protein
VSEEPVKVKLGSREYAIVAQGIGRIRRKLGQIVRVLDGAVEASELSGELYQVCKVFIPDLAPEWELLGYAGPEAYERREEPDYQEPEPSDEVVTPTVPEIEEALEAIYRVNGGERLVRLLGNVVGLDLIRAQIRRALASWEPSSRSSESSPSARDGAPSTSSTTIAPTESEPQDSPYPDSSPSSTPELAGTPVS